MPRSLLDTPTGSSVLASPPRQLPLVEELTPFPDAWQIFRGLAGLPGALFLDSASQPETSGNDRALGRYSFVTADPYDRLWEPCATRENRQAQASTLGALARLAEQLARHRVETVPGLPPFQGGAAGLFSYDLCRHFERVPRPRSDDFQIPTLAVGFYDWVIAFDHELRRAWIISTGLPEHDARRRQRRAEQRLRFIKRRLMDGAQAMEAVSTALPCPTPAYPVHGFPGLVSNFNRQGFYEAVRRVLEYIAAGDCFQVNLAQRLLSRTALAPLELYGRLRVRNPAPFAAYFNLGEHVVLSASPERFLRVEDNQVETRPIKGTRPRGATASDDRTAAEELLASAKDRAENIMIVDLLRNDLGRVCRYGSVQVPAVCRLESFRHVHHLVSEVRGCLGEQATAVDLLRAAFPGGSVTGAPKIRAMEIIAELEPSARGAYCGSLGYIGFDGSMDTNILIRTLTMSGGWVQFPVGGGIVADSVPEREYEETWHKARGLIDALGTP